MSRSSMFKANHTTASHTLRLISSQHTDGRWPTAAPKSSSFLGRLDIFPSLPYSKYPFTKRPPYTRPHSHFMLFANLGVRRGDLLTRGGDRAVLLRADAELSDDYALHLFLFFFQGRSTDRGMIWRHASTATPPTPNKRGAGGERKALLLQKAVKPGPSTSKCMYLCFSTYYDINYILRSISIAYTHIVTSSEKIRDSQSIWVIHIEQVVERYIGKPRFARARFNAIQ